MAADFDAPVTNICFVCSEEDCPDGYKLFSTCPCGHDAQLWEKVLGGKEGKRFLCFTKRDTGDGMVIEDVYIPNPSAQYLHKGFKIVKKTVDGHAPMRHRQLAVKKVPRSEAKKVVVDIIVCRSRDRVSKHYKRLNKVNSLCICVRAADYKPASSLPGNALATTEPSLLRRATEPSRRGGGGGLEEKDSDRERFHSDPAVQAYSRESTPSPPTSDDEPDEVERGSPISQSPASPTVDAVEEMATMKMVTHLASSAPPPPPHPHTQYQPDTSQTTPPPLQTAATTAGSQPPYPPPPKAGYNTTTSSSSSSTYPPAPQTYPPPNTSYNTTAYPHTNTTPNTGYPTYGPAGGYPPYPGAAPPTYAGGFPQAYNTGIGFNTGPPQGYPPQAPTGYSSVAGSTYSRISYSQNTTATGPAPYNPYTAQQQQQQQQPPNRQTDKHYGFNI